MSASKAKGTAWESKVVEALRTAGFAGAERRALRGAEDLGDITGIPGTVIEAKNCARTELAAWIEESSEAAFIDGARYAAVWHHRRGRSRPEDGFVTMSGSSFMALLRDALGIDGSNA